MMTLYKPGSTGTLLAALVSGCVVLCPVHAQQTPPAGAQGGDNAAGTAAKPAGAAAAKPAAATAVKPAAAQSAGPPTRYLPGRFSGAAGRYYKIVWGVDSLSVKLAESGEVVRFAWRVVDADKAKVLNDKKAEPSLIDPQARVSLVVPVMEKIGQLRQTAPPEVGKSYWVVFSNKGRIVKRGDRVNVVIGPFRAEGLVVD